MLLLCLTGGDTVVFPVSTVEAGIIAEAAPAVNVGGLEAGIQKFFGLDHSLDSQILFDRNTGTAAEYPAKLGFAHVEGLANILQGKGSVDVLVQISQDPILHRIRLGLCLFACLGLEGAQFMQQGDQSRKDADSGIGGGHHHSPEIVVTASTSETVGSVEILLSGFSLQ